MGQRRWPDFSRRAAPRDASLSYLPFFAYLLAELLDVEDRLTDAEDAYDLDRLRLAECRRERQKATAVLRRSQDRARRFLAAYSGCRGGRDLAPPGSTPRSGPALILHVRRTLAILGALERAAPPQDPAVSFDPGAVALGLEAGLGKLDSENLEIEDARAAADASRCRADDAVAGYDRLVPWVARGLESFCHLAGEPELADRIRSYGRR